MKTIGVVGMFHETNSFSPGKTELEDFKGEWVEGNAGFFKHFENTKTSMGGLIDGARSNELEITAGLYTYAVPGSIVGAETAETIMDAIVASIDDNIDGLFVKLHGAMVSESYDDMEGELLTRIRRKMGRALPVAVVLDLHANVSPAMVQQADFLVGFDTSPHIDMYERGVEAVDLLARQLRGEIRSVRALAKTRMLVVPQAMITSSGAMKTIMERAFAMEQLPGVLNVTVCGGFPYSDVPGAGMSFIVTTNDDEPLAAQLAEELRLLAWEVKDELGVAGLPAEKAVAEAAAAVQASGKPVILVEGSDNVGAGGPGDATYLLPPLLRLQQKSIVTVRDEQAAAIAKRLAVGAAFRGFIGGRSYEQSGKPVWVEGTVTCISDGKFRHVGPFNTGKWGNMGPAVVIETGFVTVMLTERRVTLRDIGQLRTLGIEPERYDIIAVKAAVAWKTALGTIAGTEIQVDTPGCCSFNLDHFQYDKAGALWKSAVTDGSMSQGRNRN